MDIGGNEEEFEDFIEDFIEDIGSISDKYRYRKVIGRPRKWKDTLVEKYSAFDPDEISILLRNNIIENQEQQRACDLVISLLTGSINDIERIGEETPKTLLDAVKQKIQLFDGEQTRFIYQPPAEKKVIIQGLSGTGKTELLLHKLKEIYTKEDNSRILFTCHNKILAASLRSRIPNFFDFMKVEQQIAWEERLWCVHAWGSRTNKNSGAYRYICDYYRIPFHVFSYNFTFDNACKEACDLIKEKIEEFGFCFDYVLTDESQDFPDSFLELCQLVTKETVYIAGDIFQSIFDTEIVSSVRPDFLLSKCYRTDPKTLMFAHGLGMGLFEKQKLRWLEDEEWKACGYITEIDESQNFCILHREPLRRFEDIEQEGLSSNEVIEYTKYSDINENVISAIEKIIAEHPSVQPDDIGIIFVDPSSKTYKMVDQLAQSIGRNFSWTTNKAYESKEKTSNSIFISNQNNVKGLEFPFVICVTEKIRQSLHHRNALYMMMTRSFIKTYLIISESGNEDLLPNLYRHMEEINDTGRMTIKIPSIDERVDITTQIEFTEDNLPLYDLVELVCDELNIPHVNRPKALQIASIYCDTYFDREVVHRVLHNNQKLLMS
nr:ATP-binding domain-containing protein [Halomonas sp. MCCC 1A11062]